MGALDVSKGTVKSIYALGAKLGMVERRGGHVDALHALVQGLTGKESITALTPAEAQAVLVELRRRSAPAAAPQKKRPRKYEAMPGGLSEGQQKKVLSWNACTTLTTVPWTSLSAMTTWKRTPSMAAKARRSFPLRTTAAAMRRTVRTFPLRSRSLAHLKRAP